MLKGPRGNTNHAKGNKFLFGSIIFNFQLGLKRYPLSLCPGIKKCPLSMSLSQPVVTHLKCPFPGNSTMSFLGAGGNTTKMAAKSKGGRNKNSFV